MKSIVLLIAMTLSLSVQADIYKGQTNELLKALIADASSITVIDVDDDGAQKNNLAEILAAELVGSTLRGTQVIVSVDSQCEDITDGRVGASVKSCTLTIINADYKVTKKGLVGPLLESSTTLEFKTTKAVAPRAKLKISGPVSVSRAG